MSLLDDRERLSLYKKDYYQAHATVIKARSRKHHHAHKEESAKRGALYRQNNREKISAWGSQWKKNNPDKVRSSGRKRRALKLGNGHEPYTEAEIFALWGIDCHICGEPIDFEAPRHTGDPGWELGLQMDHVIPVFKGGSDTKENVKPAHGICNLRKGTAIVEQQDVLEED